MLTPSACGMSIPDARPPRFRTETDPPERRQARRINRCGRYQIIASNAEYGLGDKATIRFAPIGTSTSGTARLGRIGIWNFAFDSLRPRCSRGRRRIEVLGLPAMWVPEDDRSREIFAHLSLLLSATRTTRYATGSPT